MSEEKNHKDIQKDRRFQVHFLEIFRAKKKKFQENSPLQQYWVPFDILHAALDNQTTVTITASKSCSSFTGKSTEIKLWSQYIKTKEKGFHS